MLHHVVVRCAALLLLAVPASLSAQTKRALLVGINRYDAHATLAASGERSVVSARKIPNLSGAVNDASAFRDLLVSRFGFGTAETRLLSDSAATRDAIIAGINELLARSRRGDVVVFYFAGHGSQRRNSLATSAARLDQTIVTADANAGAYDIRDKELARLFNPFLDRGIELILIFDSCHSGSITRGPLSPATPRFAGIDERDAADAGPGIDATPDRRGALVFSAAADYQSALERPDAAGNARGLFTVALVETLNSVSPGESAANVFRRTKARMQMNGEQQEPVIDASTDRAGRPFFGGANVAAGTPTVAVAGVWSSGIELQGGPALGLRARAVLRKLSNGPDSAVRLTVDSVLSVSRTRAQVTAGLASSVQVGDLFELEQWVSAPGAGVRLFVPSGGPNAATLEALADSLSQLRGENGIEWVDDLSLAPADSLPLAVMFWNGAGWQLAVRGAAPISLPLRPTPAMIRERLATLRGNHPVLRFALSLPPASTMAATLRTQFPANSAASLVTNIANADYTLVGRLGGDGLQYAWMQPQASAAIETTTVMPLRTDWYDVREQLNAAVDSLRMQAFVLARVRSWLQLEAPPGQSAFPYRLQISRKSDGVDVTSEPLVGGETYRLSLSADSAALDGNVERRFVYIFAINPKGEGTRLFPPAQSENRFPHGLENNRWPTRIPLLESPDIVIQPPYGVDAVFMLSSNEPVDLSAFEWRGVQNQTRSAGASGPLSDLLVNNGTRTRSLGTAVPLSWSLDRITVRTKPAQP